MKKDDPSLLVHVSKAECKAFDLLQGGMQVIPVDDEFSERMEALGFSILEGQIRDYRPLAKVIKDEAVQKIFLEILTKMDKEGEDSPELEHFYERGKEAAGSFEDVPEHDPELKHLADEGTSGDTEIAYMPLSVCDFFDGIRGKPKTNQKTGFPEYGLGNFIKSIVRVVTTVGGAIIGGPIGAAAGNALGRTITGQKPGSALMASLPNALYTMGAQGAGALAGKFLPGTALGSLGSSLGGLGGQLSAGNMMGSLTGSGAVSGAPGTTAATSGGLLGGLSGNGGIGSLLSSLAMPAALGLTAMSVNKLGKGRKEEIEAWEKENKKSRMEREMLRERYGLNDRLDPTNDSYSPIDQEHYIKESKRPISSYHSSYKKGGLTNREQKGHDLHNYVDVSESYKGKGKGQQDNLSKKLPINGYIIPADVTSMIGDGNTNSGQSLLKKLENRVKAKYKGKRVNRKLATLKGKTSSGEHQFSPLFVTLVGHGDNEKGSQKLDEALKKIRHQKSQNGVHLQPKAKPFEDYLR